MQLMLKHDAAGFETLGQSSKKEEIALGALNYAVAHGDLKIARATLNAHAKTFAGPWENAYAALLGLYFRDLSAESESAFHGVLGDQRTIGERVQSHGKTGADAEGSQALAGENWFYYGMRYGVYRTLSPETEWPQRDPEDFLAAGIERAPSTANYVNLAQAYTDAGKGNAALAEYRHALELMPDSPAVYDAMAVLLWRVDKKDEATAQWREALAALNRIQNKGPAPESFWSGFALIAQHLSSRKLMMPLRADMEAVLRNYLARNGNYRSEELLKAAFLASASSDEGVAWILSLSTAAADPAAVLAEIDMAAWLPAANREPVLLHEMELMRIAAAHKDKDDYAAWRLTSLERSLVWYYVVQKQDAKAEAILQQLPDEQRKDGEMLMAQIELAARGHRLDGLLAGYLADAAGGLPELQVLRNAAARLAKDGDKADALVLWEFVLERLQMAHGLMVSDYMGLAEARLEVGNVAGAVELLRRMTLLPDDGQAKDAMANYTEAARLLEEKGHGGEAIEFLSALAKGVPWNASYRLRLAKAQLKTGNNKAQADATLAAIAADNMQSYELRAQAARALRGENGDLSKVGSEELRLLAFGKIAAQQAEKPFFFAARIAAADSLSDPAQQAVLLRQAVAIDPKGLPGVDGFTGDDLRLKIFRAESAAGHYATALDAVQPLLHRAVTYSEPSDEAGNASAMATGDISSDENSNATDSTNDDTPAGLERLAPLPVRSPRTDSEKLALARLIARVYEETGSPASALPYLKLAAYLQKEPKLHDELQRQVDELDTALGLEAENASRRPHIQGALNQSGVVRPRLSAAELTRDSAAGVASKEAQ